MKILDPPQQAFSGQPHPDKQMSVGAVLMAYYTGVDSKETNKLTKAF